MKAYHAPIILCLFIASCGTQEGQSELDVASPVTVADVAASSIEEFITTTGTVEATGIASITSEAAGYYQPAVNPRTRRPYTAGDAVKKGTVLVTLENPEVENSAKIESQKMSLDLAKSELEKQKSLYEKGGVTYTELKTAEKTYIDAKYSYESSTIQLSKLKITAPFDGIITAVTAHTPGVRISSGASIAEVMDYRTLTMSANLPEKQLGRVRVGMEARITNVNLSGKVFPGRVTQVSPALDSSTRTFAATFSISNQSQELKPGMFVKAEVVLDRRDNAIVIAKDIITTRRDAKVVYVVERGLASERRLTTGIENPDSVEVTQGLAAGDRLVIKGYETLRDRAKVKVSE